MGYRTEDRTPSRRNFFTFLDLGDCNAGEDDMSDIYLSSRFRRVASETQSRSYGRMAPVVPSAVGAYVSGKRPLEYKENGRAGGHIHPDGDLSSLPVLAPQNTRSSAQEWGLTYHQAARARGANVD